MVSFNRPQIEGKTFMQDAWDEFSAKIMPSVKPESDQYNDLKATYYAGCLQIMQLCNALGDENVDGEKADLLLSSIHDELDDFFATMIAKKL